MQERTYNIIDRVIMTIDAMRHSADPANAVADDTYPAKDSLKPALSHTQRRISASLMRVNHAGEIAAQALYQAQAIVARDASICVAMRQAAEEEMAHLYWCDRRLRELQSAPSRLVPLWFTGAFVIGLVAGGIGDRWNLGFLAETEQQVVRHLQAHIAQLSTIDPRSCVILEQMQRDEEAHACHAMAAGGLPLPVPVRISMWCCSRVMSTVAYFI